MYFIFYFYFYWILFYYYTCSKIFLILNKVTIPSLKKKKTNSITDHDNSRNLGNSNRINSDNYIDNDINNECNNTRELVNITNSDSKENNNRNLDSSNNFISIMTKGLNSNSDESSSNWRGVYSSWWKEKI